MRAVRVNRVINPMIHNITKITISQSQKNYYILGRTQKEQQGRSIHHPKRYEFISSSIRSKELELYKKTITNPSIYYPNSALLVFDKEFLAEDFYQDVAQLGKISFPALHLTRAQLWKGQLVFTAKEETEAKEMLQMIELSFEDLLGISKLVKSNLFMVQKYKCISSMVYIYGAFLPILLDYVDSYTQSYLTSSLLWEEE